MKKGAKKGLTVAGVCIILILISLISIPFLFKGKIKEAVINTANTNLNAKVQFDDFGLNIFSHFPNVTLSLDNVSITGIDDFEGDTLLKAKSADATLNIIQLLKGNYEVSRININETMVYAKVLTDGRVNWDILKSDQSSELADNDSTTDESPFQLKLQKISLQNCKLTYEDQESSMKIVLANWSGNVSGDFSADNTILKTKSTIGEVSFTMDGIPYLTKIKGVANAIVDADMNKVKFTFVESDIQLNKVKASLDGSVALIGDDGKDFDLRLNAPNIQFRDILSILPAMYTTDFKDIKTSGTASLNGFVKGMMQGDEYPAFNFKLSIGDAMFQYPSLAKSVNNINVDMNIDNKGGSLDNTVLDINKFNFTIGSNPFISSLHIQTPISDPNLKAHINGTIDMAMIKEVYPLDANTQLNGILSVDLSIATRMSAIENEQYQNVQASGSLKLNNMTYQTADMQQVVINKASLDFSTQYVNLSSMDMRIGKNDIAASGRLENIIAYILKDQTLKGNLNISSTYFNLNDFMNDADSSEASSESNTQSDNFVVPVNLNFVLDANVNQVIYEKVNISNLKGRILVKEGTIYMQDVSANVLGGTAKVTGSYSTVRDPRNPQVTLGLNVNKASFAETFKSVETIQKFAPIFEKVLGNYSMNMNLSTVMGGDIMQMLEGLTASGALQTNEVQVQGVEALAKLSSALKTDVLKNFNAKDINIPFSIKNGKIDAKPFAVNIGDGGKVNLSGLTGLDQSINYKGTVTLPKSLSNNYVKTIPISIAGTFTEPKISVDTKSLINSLTDQAAEQLLGGNLNDKKEEVVNKLNEEKTKQIQAMRDNANLSYEKLVEEAQKQGNKLVEAAEPKGAIAKLAAQKAADRLVTEAKKNGQKLLDDAETQIKKLDEQQISK